MELKLLKPSMVLFLVLITKLSFTQVSVAVISDLKQTPQTVLLIDSLIQEIDKTIGFNKKVISSGDQYFFGLLEESTIQETYRNISADLVLTVGGLSTQSISVLPNLEIPVIGLGVVDPFVQNIPFNDGKSGKENFTYVLTSRDIISEIESFKKLVDFDSLSMLIDPAISRSFSQSNGRVMLDSIQSALNIQITTIEASESIDEVCEKVASAEAVFLPPLVSYSLPYIAQLSNCFRENRVPSFSSSKSHVELGILGSASGDNGWQKVLRRVAITADDILSGRPAGDISVFFNTTESFFLNIETARDLGISPPFEVVLTANLIEPNNDDSNGYSFSEIANKALEENLDLKISYKDIEASMLDVRTGKSNLFPAITSALTGSQINEERANSVINSPERSLNLDFTLSQVVFSEEVLAAIKTAQYLQTAQEYRTETEALDILFDTYTAYLDVLAAKTNMAILRDNLENTRTNLELAKIRVDVGSSVNSDLYRWESELANATQSLIEAQAGLLVLKIQLNNLLANSLEDGYELKDIGVNDELFSFYKEGPIGGLIKTPELFARATAFLEQESINNNPNKKELLENIKASERQLALTKRLFYLPTVALQAQHTSVLARGGAGSENIETDPNLPAFGPGIQDNAWSAGVSLSYPIFTGFTRRIDKQKAMVQLDQFNFASTSLDQALGLSIKASAANLLTTTTNLDYSEISATNADLNFQLVQSKYKAGEVSITQLIDAQQAALRADLAQAVSVYDFISANLQLEYSLGFFSMFLTDDEIVEFQNRFLQFVSDN